MYHRDGVSGSFCENEPLTPSFFSDCVTDESFKLREALFLW